MEPVIQVDREVDARGLNCPLPILRTKKTLNDMESGQVVRILATDPASVRDFEAFARQTGNPLLAAVRAGGSVRFPSAPEVDARPRTATLSMKRGRSTMSEQAASVLELTEENFATSIDDHPFAVVDFWAPWCAPCRAFAPTFAAAAAKHPDVLFAKVNTEDQQGIGAHFNIRSIPTLMIFRRQHHRVRGGRRASRERARSGPGRRARTLDMEQMRREIAAKKRCEPAAQA